MFVQTEEGVKISLFVQPNAPKSEIIGPYNNALKIKIHAPPVDGKANTEIQNFLSKVLDISKSKIEILKGDKSKIKTVLIIGTTVTEIQEKLKLGLSV